MIASEVKGQLQHLSKFPGKTHYLGLGYSKLKAAHPVNYFPRFLAKNVKNYPPSKLFLFTSLQGKHICRVGQLELPLQAAATWLQRIDVQLAVSGVGFPNGCSLPTLKTSD